MIKNAGCVVLSCKAEQDRIIKYGRIKMAATQFALQLNLNVKSCCIIFH